MTMAIANNQIETNENKKENLKKAMQKTEPRLIFRTFVSLLN